MTEALMAEYVTIHLFAAPAVLADLVLLGGLYGKQQIQLGMALLLSLNRLNLLLDLIFINGFGMTVDGVAFASVAAQWSGFGFMLWWIAQGSPGQLGQLLRPLAGANCRFGLTYLRFANFSPLAVIFSSALFWGLAVRHYIQTKRQSLGIYPLLPVKICCRDTCLRGYWPE